MGALGGSRQKITNHYQEHIMAIDKQKLNISLSVISEDQLGYFFSSKFVDLTAEIQEKNHRAGYTIQSSQKTYVCPSGFMEHWGYY